EVDAFVECTFPAQRAVAARHVEARDDSVAGFETVDPPGPLLAGAADPMTQQLTGAHRYAAVVGVEVRAADRAEGHFDQRLVVAAERRLGHVDALHLRDALVGRRLHAAIVRALISYPRAA